MAGERTKKRGPAGKAEARFPLAAKYPTDWLAEDCYGANPLWLAEWLCRDLPLEEGMRVLDLGCGRARSSVFLAAEFGVRVWAADLWADPTDNHRTVLGHGLGEKVFPVAAGARELPFAHGFFDAVVSFDAIQYFGTDMLFLPYIVQFLRPRGLIGFASPGMVREFRGEVPDHLRPLWTSDYWCLRSAEWWREHWERTGLVGVELSETMEDGWKLWAEWARIGGSTDWYRRAVEDDAGRHLGYIRQFARKNEDAPDLPYDLRTGEWRF